MARSLKIRDYAIKKAIKYVEEEVRFETPSSNRRVK